MKKMMRVDDVVSLKGHDRLGVAGRVEKGLDAEPRPLQWGHPTGDVIDGSSMFCDVSDIVATSTTPPPVHGSQGVLDGTASAHCGMYPLRVVNKSEAVIDRIRRLEKRRSGARINSARHHQLTKAIRVEADLYRQSLDAEQASELFDPKPTLPALGPAARSRSTRLPLITRPKNRLLASLPANEFRVAVKYLNALAVTAVRTTFKRRYPIIEALNRVRKSTGKAHDFDVRRIAAVTRRREDENPEGRRHGC